MRFVDDEDQRIISLVRELKEIISQKKLVLIHLKELFGAKEAENKYLFFAEASDLKNSLNKLNERTEELLSEIILPKIPVHHVLGLPSKITKLEKKKEAEMDELEREVLKRLKKGTRARRIREKPIKEDSYAKFANRLFSNYSKKLIEKGHFQTLKRDLERANLNYTFPGYISIVLFTTLLSVIIGLAVLVFFMFVSIHATPPFIKFVEDIGSRLIKLIWIPFVFPVIGFFMAYSYPSMDSKASETLIDFELPFATINMAAISGSMINPVKIFEIIISSEEFPNIKKEFIKLVNEINIYGYDIVSALRNTAVNTPSRKFAELLNGLATTINSGGDLTKFLEKRAETLLFEHRMLKEKETKMAETFMDIYISVVIAAPMIFLLLLMVMKISGLGVTLPTSTINLIMIASITAINVFFLIFLHMKKTE